MGMVSNDEKGKSLVNTVAGFLPQPFQTQLIMSDDVDALRQSGSVVIYDPHTFRIIGETTFVVKEASAKGMFGCRMTYVGNPTADFWLQGVDSPTDLEGKKRIADKIAELEGHDKLFAIGDFNNRLSFHR